MSFGPVNGTVLDFKNNPVGKLTKGYLSKWIFFVVTEARNVGKPVVGGMRTDKCVIPLG